MFDWNLERDNVTDEYSLGQVNR